MKLVVISPEHHDDRETAVVSGLFAAGLERYHVRKPQWPREQLESWLRTSPREWRSRLVVHQHHELAESLELGGVHWRDDARNEGRADGDLSRRSRRPHMGLTSRSCHDLAALRGTLGNYDSVFFSPVFPSLSKPGHAPPPDFSFAALSALLATRTPAQRRTSVLALGGITAETAPRALALGFDGVAVLGAIWQARDPVRAFVELQSALACHAA